MKNKNCLIIIRSLTGTIIKSFLASEPQAEKFYELNFYTFNKFSITIIKLTK